MSKVVEVVPYDSKWPELFEVEAKCIKEALKENCLAVYHVGSTSVPGLSAKPKIDIIAVVKDSKKIFSGLKDAGYLYKGEFNIPFHFGFSKRERACQANLHVYEEGNPEIALNLSFRDYLRHHPEAVKEYESLKFALLKDPSSHQKNGKRFTGYNLGKDRFIKEILRKSGFQALCLRLCTHHDEWEAVEKFRQRYFGKEDSYIWTFDHPDHFHFIFYQGAEIVGYAHIELLQNQQAILKFFIIDDAYQEKDLKSYFLNTCKRWLEQKNYQLVRNQEV